MQRWRKVFQCQVPSTLSTTFLKKNSNNTVSEASQGKIRSIQMARVQKHSNRLLWHSVFLSGCSVRRLCCALVPIEDPDCYMSSKTQGATEVQAGRNIIMKKKEELSRAARLRRESTHSTAQKVQLRDILSSPSHPRVMKCFHSWHVVLFSHFGLLSLQPWRKFESLRYFVHPSSPSFLSFLWMGQFDPCWSVSCGNGQVNDYKLC